MAKCRIETDGYSAASVRIAHTCAETFSPGDLIRLLQPSAVLLASLQLDLVTTEMFV